MKYYKLDDVVYAFEENGSQDCLITKQMQKMTNDEIDRHINPEKYLSASEVYKNYIKSLRPLTRRQFKLVLLDNDLLDQVETAIDSIQDLKDKTKMQIEYMEATEFKRDSESLSYMCNLLGLTEQQINTMWEHALTL